LVYVCPDAAIPQDIRHAVAGTKQKGFPVNLVAVSDKPIDVEGADITLFDVGQRFQTRYAVSAGGAYLFRPDQHVCARWLQLDASRFVQSLHKALMQ
jgi:3-(3-hydroxy-phenyl)propionate hydroxylase